MPLSVSQLLPFFVILSTIHFFSLLSLLALLILYLRARISAPDPSPLKRTYVTVLIAIALLAVPYHVLSMTEFTFLGVIKSSFQGCASFDLGIDALSMSMVVLSVGMSVQLHRVFLLQKVKDADKLAKWYIIFALVLPCVNAALYLPVILNPLTQSKTDALCNLSSSAISSSGYAINDTDQLPLTLIIYRIVVTIQSVAFVIYILAISSFVSMVSQHVLDKLSRVKQENQVRNMTTTAANMRKVSKMMIDQPASTPTNSAPASPWLRRMSKSVSRLEDKDTLLKIKYVSWYPILCVLLLALPTLLEAMVFGVFQIVKISLYNVADLANMIALIPGSLLGLSLFIAWTLDPTYTTVLRKERAHIARMYVQESRLNLDRRSQFSAWQKLNRFWQRLMWLSKADIAKAEKEAQIQFLEGGQDMELGVEESVNDFSSDEERTLDGHAEPYPQQATSVHQRALGGGGDGFPAMRRGSTADRQRRKQSIAGGGGIGGRKPSITVQMSNPIPGAMNYRQKSGAAFPGMQGPAGFASTPFHTPPRSVPAALGRKNSVTRPMFQSNNPMFRRPSMFRRGSTVAQEISLDDDDGDDPSDGENDIMEDTAQEDPLNQFMSPAVYGRRNTVSVNDGSGRGGYMQRAQELGVPTERIRRLSDAI